MLDAVRTFLSLDGSEKDQRALQVTDAFAELTGGDIHLVRVVPVPATKTSFGMAMLGVTAGREELRDAVERGLRDTAQRLASLSRGSRNVTWEVIDGVDVAAELLRRAETGADVIVMATRAPGTVKRAFFGSVADTIVRDATCPVVVVPPGAKYASGKRIALHRALVPLDGSRASGAVIDRMLELLPTGTVEYVLMQDVHIESTGGYMMPEPVHPALPGDHASSAPRVLHIQAEQTEQHLNELAARLRELGERASVVVSEAGDPAAGIHEAIRGELVDLIAMSTRGAGGVQRVLLGSVANRVVRTSEVPVLLVTPRSSSPASVLEN
jgi:nucleotide-binding universal stress UspA family protein